MTSNVKDLNVTDVRSATMLPMEDKQHVLFYNFIYNKLILKF